MAAMFQRRNVDVFKTIILRLARSRFCSTEGSNVDQSNENISNDSGADHRGKRLDLVVPSLRVDRVLASALGIGRRFVVKIEILLTCSVHLLTIILEYLLPYRKIPITSLEQLKYVERVFLSEGVGWVGSEGGGGLPYEMDGDARRLA